MWVWFGISISCAAIHNRFLKVVFVVILCSFFAHLLCRTGNGIAAEYIVGQPSLLSMRILHMYFAAQEMELPLNNSKSFTFGLD